MQFRSSLVVVIMGCLSLYAQKAEVRVLSFTEERGLVALSKEPGSHVELFLEGMSLHPDFNIERLFCRVQGVSSPLRSGNYLSVIFNNTSKGRKKYLTDLIAWDSIPSTGGKEFNGIHFFLEGRNPPALLYELLGQGITIYTAWFIQGKTFSIRCIQPIHGKDLIKILGSGELQVVNNHRWLVIKNTDGKILSILLLGQPFTSPIDLPHVVFNQVGPLADEAIYQSLARMLTSVRITYSYRP